MNEKEKKEVDFMVEALVASFATDIEKRKEAMKNLKEMRK